MKWTRGHSSGALEDRRGGGGGRAAGIGGLGVVGTVVVLVIGHFTGLDVSGLLGGGDGGGGEPIPADQDADRELVEFVSFVLDDAQGNWAAQLPRETGTPYREAKLVLFREGVQTGCGSADSGVGPFYCPADERVYIDLSFYRLLDSKFGAPGDFAQAYVLAHEIGHHVQHITGMFEKGRDRERRGEDANAVSVRQELQADCYAGIWAHATRNKQLLEAGDIEEGLAAAAAVGDDTLQKRSRGGVQPETWTHGSAAQRQKWFRKGLDGGKVSDCDTFAVESP
ncbi:MAG: neutral zinc metallopeptidase [Deltaproteobacteria bacterium]|nr:neutral zinc metallopeptidase [Nannocystaceae bacterium]